MPLRLVYKATEKDSKKSLGDFLKRQDLSKKAIVALKHRGGKICINNEERTTRFILNVGDEISVTFPNEPVSDSLSPIKMNINVIYEDDFILVVDKKVGLPMIPTGSHDIALANGILAYYAESGLKSTVHFVNRLDKDTSGLLVVAKYRHIHHLMTADIKSITRKYYARVAGILTGSSCINAPILKSSAIGIKRVVDMGGQHAMTRYEAIQTHDESTLVRCTLETGRTHQIRVHMAHINHPILKDPLYGNGAVGDMQLLHSYFLAFVHPISGKKLSFETKVPMRFEMGE